MIRRISAAETRLLRQQILRPTYALQQLVYSGDDDPDTLHVGAFGEAGMLVGIATCVRQAPAGGRYQPPDETHPDDPRAWRIRGMGTTDVVRGTGLGAAMLRACIDHAQAQNGTRLWCDARETARGFYAKYGFVERGEPYDVPVIGLHYFMELWLSASSGK